MLVQFVTNGLISGILYSLLAIGFALVYNTTKVFHIAAAGIWAFATYMYFVFSKSQNLPPIVAICLAILICMILSLLIDCLVYRPLYRRKASTGVMMIASIGILIVLDSLSKISSTMAGWTTMAPTPYKGLGVLVRIGENYVELTPFIVGGIVLIVFLFIIRLTGLGVSLRAMSSNQDLYSLFGNNPMKIRTLAFLLSGLFIALSACLLVGKGGGGAVMDKEEGLAYFVYALAAMIIGGTGRYGACVVGGLFVGISEKVIEGYDLSPWIGVVVFGLLILTLLFRPQGIVGQKQRSV